MTKKEKLVDENMEGTGTPVVEEKGVTNEQLDLLRDETSVKAIAGFYKVLAKHADALAYKHDATEESQTEVTARVCEEFVNVLIDCKVPNKDMQTIYDRVSADIYRIMETIRSASRSYERDLLARTMGVTNPVDTDVYDYGYSTLGDLYAAVEKIRTAQGVTNTEPEEKPAE